MSKALAKVLIDRLATQAVELHLLRAGPPAGPQPDAESQARVVAALQDEMALLATLADTAREEACALRDQVTLGQGRIRLLIEERDALHASLTTQHDDNDRLRERIALLEADLEQMGEASRAAQAKAAFTAENRVLDGRADRLAAPVIIEAVAVDLEAVPDWSGPTVDVAPETGILEMPTLEASAVTAIGSGDRPEALSPPDPMTAATGAARPGQFQTIFTPAALSALDAGYRQGLGWDDLIAHLQAVAGRTYTKRQLIDKSKYMGLTGADRAVPVFRGRKAGSPAPNKGQPQPRAGTAVAIVPPGTPVPEPVPGMSRLAREFGEDVRRGLKDFLSYEEIAAGITPERLTGQQVKSIALELKRLGHDEATA